MKWEYIIIHHSLTRDDDKLSWGAIRDYHKGKGWKDIGYHAGVEKIRGRYEVLLGRPWDRKGAHTKGYNDKAIGLCLVGDFDHRPPPCGQLVVAAELVKWWMRWFGVERENVKGHRDFTKYKSCPGNSFSMELFRKLLK